MASDISDSIGADDLLLSLTGVVTYQVRNPGSERCAVAWSVVVEVPACLACGACCFSQLEEFARVTGDDYERLGELADGLVRFDGFRGYMRMTDGHCAALVVDAQSGRWTCGAYAGRPQVCRDLARASGECLAELDAKVERPLAALRLVASRLVASR